jgi:chromosome segregation ATPase
MENVIKTVISGDETLSKNVVEAKEIYDYINKSYELFQKMAKTQPFTNQDNIIDDLKEQTKAAENLNKTIIEKIKLQNNENKSLADLKKTITDYENQLKTLKSAKDKDNQAIVETELNLKKVRAEYSQNQKQILKNAEAQKTIQNLSDKQNLTLTEQKQLFAALNVEYNKLVTTQGAASNETLELQQKMDKLNSEIKQAEESVGIHTRSVGDYGKALKDSKDKLNLLILKEQDLINTNNKSSKEYNELQTEIKQTVTEIKSYAAAQEKLQTRTNSLIASTNKQKLSLKDLVGGFTAANLITNGIQKLGQELKDQIVNIKEFEVALDSLASITGLTGSDLTNV